ncbi:tRNA 5-methylaminomethyl-2-thiouridine biosynthesis bifunctional protein [Marinobacter daqiaonensis]|uniref:tRNA 5-methylaminomethyl-2-thiouridine biosynthesis bifunctional protein MnmC n=1 Tax=Marinobacter daqiaonensis TaxID=650891 RepID=A0A1I6GMR6_9GAMM|nr:bifunctional tRNA (5-methylaminomethyl-2-thiouridine)(34)-methyltransferase MnmD/FAD-dependent 5-carboxymethylaminomethyl-2-thiouridine(34) oxidoreductase MnmC [Marinobacter daqiaonensis]SFR43458.1 tRNA 5-methylaminomethyl-2-thiouridine biosynthesis bifunctional protein [Marinobacter daqiaonensis]
MSQGTLAYASIETADIEWRDGQPVSRRFGDVYFSRDNGLEETRHVFLNQNNLGSRFSALQSGECFVVGETGFGTGLNFLATWHAFLAQAPADAHLHFVSVERFPLTRDDLAAALNLWPELAAQAGQLLAVYPPPVPGSHRLVMAESRIRLTLYLGDALEALEELDFTADAWFLDGFAPACNPELWEPSLVQQIRAHSRAGSTLATFTAAGRIRRALADAGFRVERVPGYGPKRDMTSGSLAPESTGKRSSERPQDRSVLVVGAGIAGCLLARNLAQRGIRVVVADQAQAPGAGASGNPQGALYAKLGVQFNAQTRLALGSLLFAQRFYPAVTPHAWHGTGLLMMASSDQERARQDKFLAGNHYPSSILKPVDESGASDLTGIPCPDGGLWFPDSGWLEPPKVCALLLDHPHIQPVFGFRATRLLPCNNHWCLSGEGQQDLMADDVVLAAGHEVRKLMPVAGEYRMKPIRGQITRLPLEQLTVSPRAVVTGNRYLNPPLGNTLVTGATFDLRDPDPQERRDSHLENLEALQTMVPGLLRTPAEALEKATGRVAFRCTTHDYQPVVGPLVNDRKEVLEGAWLLTGFGSKGLMWGPLMAEYLADRICGQPVALPHSLMRRVDPARCLAKTPNRLP